MALPIRRMARMQRRSASPGGCRGRVLVMVSSEVILILGSAGHLSRELSRSPRSAHAPGVQGGVSVYHPSPRTYGSPAVLY